MSASTTETTATTAKAVDEAPGLGSYWHPIAKAEDVTDQPKRFHLLGVDLVAFRDGEGRVSVFRDLCIHRGAALSLGTVKNGNITCAYHGWEYDRTGKCVRIPALSKCATIPGKARAIAYQAEERYGLVWTALNDPVLPIPEWPNDEYHSPEYHAHLSSHNIWRTSAGRAVENFMDYSHFPIVHPNLLAPPEQTEVTPIEVTQTANGLQYVYSTIEPESPTSKEGQVVRFEYHVIKPFTVHLCKVAPDGHRTWISLMASPSSAKRTQLFITFVRNYDHDQPDSIFDHFSNRVLEQDRRVVESQRPEEIPTDLREELHIKHPDASAIAYRRMLGTIAGIGEYLP